MPLRLAAFLFLVIPLDDDTAGFALSIEAHPPQPVFGARFALILALVLLASYALILALRWQNSRSPAVIEVIVQQPVPVDNAPADSRAEVTAPDPGDHP